MKKSLEKKVTLLAIILLCGLVFFIIFQGILIKANGKSKADENKVYATPDVAMAVVGTQGTTEPTAEATTQPTTQKPTEPTTEATTAKPTTEPTTEPTIVEETVKWATVMTLETKASLQEQWDNGYLVAIDYPDKIYQTYHIELTEEDRDVLEHLCMGEFGSGGFIGPALIAQAVKDAMCFDGYKTVEEVRVKCRYDASLDNEPTQDVKDAVSYVFDQDKAAVQHRIMYMYNPYMVSSAFHESQNYVLTYEGIRFFDRWGY